ncbi:Universal stress protein [Schistosoma japonicum]|uniref:Universal stress protein n=1 Tax=Schistosoma japonicum TaxID=6182 RepID=A0A4Z2DP26_SCHJA|nr:Universal stress protein [Schistosoma japonicum]
MDTPPLTDITKIMQDNINEGGLRKKYIAEAKEFDVNCEGIPYVDTQPDAALLKSIEDHNANLIIMRNKGLGVLRRNFLGSVSDYVLHHAHIPVVIVPPKTKH